MGVTRMLQETKPRGGELTPDEFTDFIKSRVLPRIAARFAAHLTTHKVLIPLAGIALNAATSQLHIGQAIERQLIRHGQAEGPKGAVVKKVKNIATHKVVSKLSPIVGSLVSMQIASQAAAKLQVEHRLGYALGDNLTGTHDGDTSIEIKW